MKSHVKVVVIGGGVVGCSVLFHLTKLGWRDVLLVERSELTSGSTWHAAGGFHTLNADTNMAALQGYTIQLYKDLEAISGQSCGLHHVGGVTLATTKERMDFLKAERAKHRYMGLETEILDAKQIQELTPITNTEGVLGGLYDPLDGHLDPSGTTHAYAKAARAQGAEISLRNPVIELCQRANESWDVVTKNGTVNSEYLVNAGGLWAREIGNMIGVVLPLHPMEHQYLVTDDIESVYQRKTELPHVMDPAGESYLRQEGRGLVVGFYEQSAQPWAIDGTPWDFGHELLPEKLDRLSDSLQYAFNRFPVLETAGIKRTINGPFTFSPDGNPLVGPVAGFRNYWVACAVMAGFSQGGGVGLSLAEWMIEGEPGRDIFAMDVSRFGDYCTQGYTRNKVVENYQRRFAISYPNEELPAARPVVTTPAYSIWRSQNAVFGEAYGLEHVNYFARPGDVPYEIPSFRRSNAFEAVGAECRAVRSAVGINEIHNFSKFLVTGSGAASWLDRIMAGRLPKVGRLSLSPMLSDKGKLMGDFSISRLAEQKFWLTASYASQSFHMRWFERNILPDEDVSLQNISLEYIGFQIAGPNSRELLSRVTKEDVSNSRLPFMSLMYAEVGLCDALVKRVSYTGDLGYEIYVPALQQLTLYECLIAAGHDLGLKPFGMRAMMSLRLEKSFGAWGREFRYGYIPAETRLDRFIDFNKDINFIGKTAALSVKSTGPQRLLCTFVVEAKDADAWADEPIWYNGDVVGFVTSGGYAHFAQKSVAMGFVPTPLVCPKLNVEIEIVGERCPASLIAKPLFDRESKRLRG